MTLRNLSQIILLIAPSFIQTSFASDVKEMNETTVTSRLNSRVETAADYSIKQTVTLMDEENNDSTCKSLYRGAHTKYHYLKGNSLLLPTFLASQYLAYYMLWPAGTDLFQLSDLIALQPYMVVFPCIVAIFVYAYIFLDEPPTVWRSRK